MKTAQLIKREEYTVEYNHFYNGRAISKMNFLSNVPTNWEDDVKNGEYSYGYYRAILRES